MNPHQIYSQPTLGMNYSNNNNNNNEFNPLFGILNPMMLNLAAMNQGTTPQTTSNYYDTLSASFYQELLGSFTPTSDNFTLQQEPNNSNEKNKQVESPPSDDQLL